MIVIRVDVRKRSLTGVAADQVGRPLAEQTTVDGTGLLAWAATLPGERLWAVEDCRQLTRALERDLLAAGERAGAGAAEADRAAAADRPDAGEV